MRWPPPGSWAPSRAVLRWSLHAEGELGVAFRKSLAREGDDASPTHTLLSPGPAANLRHNLNEVVVSLGCTVELQINNTRAAWRVSTAPLRAVFKGLLVSTPRGQGLGAPLFPGGLDDISWES